jgi:hypothetical protein
MAEQLSPAAQAILNGFLANWQDVFLDQDRACIAAAIEALADQVLPENAEPVGDEHDAARADQWLRIRLKILAIAAELLRAARRPKPPSLKEQALEELAWVDRNLKGANFFGSCHAVHIIRRALEQLDD